MKNLVPSFEDFLNERNFSKEKREKLADKGFAMKDGSYPIKNVEDLKNAIQSFGRTGNNPEETKNHIIKRAKALGKIDLLPDKWDVKESKLTKSSGISSEKPPVNDIEDELEDEHEENVKDGDPDKDKEKKKK